MMDSYLLAALLIFLGATLYSSVGHGGASAYLAVMALLGISGSTMRPTILALNIMVASIGFANFARRGFFLWSRFWPFALASIPFAWLGGSLTLPEVVYKKIIGLVLVFAAYRLWKPSPEGGREQVPPARLPSLALGGGIGLLSGLTGVGGGIFLSPILILKGWAAPKQASAVSAAFIVVNSIAGLLSLKTKAPILSTSFAIWALAAVTGGLLGSHFGSGKLTSIGLQRTLSVVLIVASIKLLFF